MILLSVGNIPSRDLHVYYKIEGVWIEFGMNWTQIDKIDLGRFVKGHTGRLDKLSSLENWLVFVLSVNLIPKTVSDKKTHMDTQTQNE